MTLVESVEKALHKWRYASLEQQAIGAIDACARFIESNGCGECDNHKNVAAKMRAAVTSTDRPVLPCDPNDHRPIWEQGLGTPSTERPHEPATPAVGGKAVAWLYEMAFYIKPTDNPPLKNWKQVVTIAPPPAIPEGGVRNVLPLFAAQPAAPLRGREALLAAQSALNNPINMNLRDRAFRAINLALSAAPTEQPAAAQPQYLADCNSPDLCMIHGVCMVGPCPNEGKVIVKRVCVEPQQDGIVYPGVDIAND